MTYGSKPLLNFSASDTHATLLTEDLISDQEITKHTPKKKPRKTKTSGTRGIKIIRGKVALHVPGYIGVQKFAAIQLVKFVPIGKLKTAAKRILKTFKRRPTSQQQGRKREQFKK